MYWIPGESRALQSKHSIPSLALYQLSHCAPLFEHVNIHMYILIPFDNHMYIHAITSIRGIKHSNQG